jgi:hypothetical protein
MSMVAIVIVLRLILICRNLITLSVFRGRVAGVWAMRFDAS